MSKKLTKNLKWMLDKILSDDETKEYFVDGGYDLSDEYQEWLEEICSKMIQEKDIESIDIIEYEFERLDDEFQDDLEQEIENYEDDGLNEEQIYLEVLKTKLSWILEHGEMFYDIFSSLD